jgi:hypothetical protein
MVPLERDKKAALLSIFVSAFLAVVKYLMGGTVYFSSDKGKDTTLSEAL